MSGLLPTHRLTHLSYLTPLPASIIPTPTFIVKTSYTSIFHLNFLILQAGPPYTVVHLKWQYSRPLVHQTPSQLLLPGHISSSIATQLERERKREALAYHVVGIIYTILLKRMPWEKEGTLNGITSLPTSSAPSGNITHISSPQHRLPLLMYIHKSFYPHSCLKMDPLTLPPTTLVPGSHDSPILFLPTTFFYSF